MGFIKPKAKSKNIAFLLKVPDQEGYSVQKKLKDIFSKNVFYLVSMFSSPDLPCIPLYNRDVFCSETSPTSTPFAHCSLNELTQIRSSDLYQETRILHWMVWKMLSFITPFFPAVSKLISNRCLHPQGSISGLYLTLTFYLQQKNKA